MASKSIDWDELLLTNDPKKKEIEVSFKKIDGEGDLISKGDEAGTPGGVIEGEDGSQPPTDDEGDFEEQPDGDGGPIDPGPNDCEVWDCDKWRAYADAGYDQFEDDGNWASRVAKFYTNKREFDTIGSAVLDRKIIPDTANVSSRNRSAGEKTQWKNFLESASPFYSPRTLRTHNLRESNGETEFNARKGYNQHEDQVPIAIGADFNNANIGTGDNAIMCDPVAHQSNSGLAGRFASDLDYAFESPDQQTDPGLLYNQNYKSVFVNDGFVTTVEYGWDGYNVFDLTDGGSARGYLEAFDDWIQRLWLLYKQDQVGAPSFEVDRRGTGLREAWEKRRYSGLFASNDNEVGSYVSPAYLPTYVNDPATNRPTVANGPQIYVPAFAMEHAFLSDSGVENAIPNLNTFGSAQSMTIHLFHNALVVRTFDSSSASDNVFGWKVFKKDWWPADKPFLGWISMDITYNWYSKKEKYFNDNPASGLLAYEIFENGSLDVYLNGDAILEDVKIATVANQLRYLYGVPGSTESPKSFFYVDENNTIYGMAVGPGNADGVLGVRDAGTSIATSDLVCLALYEGQDALELPRSRFGRGILRQLNNPETYPIYCSRIP